MDTVPWCQFLLLPIISAARTVITWRFPALLFRFVLLRNLAVWRIVMAIV